MHKNLAEYQVIRAISNARLNMLPCLHLHPINQLVSLCPYFLTEGKVNLEACFTLRCIQRLSLTHIATQPLPLA
jgi:hypothetical protein